MSNIADERLPIGDELDFYAAEAYTTLRTNINLTVFDKAEGKIISVVSSNPGEGKTTTAVNLSYFLAKGGFKTLLIEGDLRKPSIKRKLGLAEEEGLTNILCSGQNADKIIIKNVMIDNFDVLTCGTIPPNPSELLQSDKMEELLNKLSKKYDYIVVDLPPVNVVVDAIAISKYSDGYILVCRKDVAYKKEIANAIKKLEDSKARIIGIVVTSSTTKSGGYNDYHNHYYKGYYKGYYNEYKQSPTKKN